MLPIWSWLAFSISGIEMPHTDPLLARVFWMRRQARRTGKAVPTKEQCLALIEATGMVCPVPSCGKEMTLHAPRHQGVGDVVSLQHARDGSMHCICHGCNSRDRDLPSDWHLWNCPKGQKWCNLCGCFKPLEEFRSGAMRGHCRACIRPIDAAMHREARRAAHV
jgi:hypothetical protein